MLPTALGELAALANGNDNAEAAYGYIEKTAMQAGEVSTLCQELTLLH